MSLNSENIKAGFRLVKLEVYNWGTFDGKVYNIKPDGFNGLLTGDIGSGKSTLVDAVTTLIVPQQKIIYNKAAGAESKTERNLLTYVRGEHTNRKDEQTGSSKPVYLRNEDQYSVILGHFLNEGFSQHVTLAQVFWLKNGKVEKLFVLADSELSIKEHFSDFDGDISKLKKKLKAQNGIEIPDTFSAYSVRFCQLFGITQREEALDLFYQTVSMKSVGNLTEFVRNQMLGKTDVKATIEELIKSFDNLTDTHNSVLKAKDQISILDPVISDVKEYEALNKIIIEKENVIKDLEKYFSIEKITILKSELNNFREDYHATQNKIYSIKKSIFNLTEELNSIKQSILNSEIGRQLENLEKGISDLTIKAKAQKNEFENYQNICEKLQLKGDVDEDQFYQNRKKLDEIEKEIEESNKMLREKRDELVITRRKQQEAIKDLQDELDSLKNRQSQIPVRIFSMRERIAQDLEILPSDIPFVGELLEVKDEDKDWEGAIERRLHDFGLSILVQEKDFTRIRNYVDSTDLKNKIVYLRTLPHERKNSHDIPENSLINKLNIKNDSIFYEWLEEELTQRHNLVCCETMEEFNRHSFAITIKGQIRSGRTKYEKDDRRNIYDKSNYILGWSNEQKIKAYQKDLVERKKDLDGIEKEIESISISEKNYKNKAIHLNDLKKYVDFESINFKKSILEKDRLQNEFEVLKNSKGTEQYNKLKERDEELSAEIKSLDDDRDKAQTDLGEKRNNIGVYAKQLFDSYLLSTLIEEKALKAIIDFDEDVFQNLNYHVDNWLAIPISDAVISEANKLVISELLVNYTLNIQNVDLISKELDKKLNNEVSEDRKITHRKSNNIISGIRTFKIKYPGESADFDAQLEYIDEIKKVHKKLVDDDLPKHEEKLKKLMREGTIKDLVIFSSNLDRYEKEIKRKIDEINSHLVSIDYNTGTFIKIIGDKVQTDDIKTFRIDLRNATQGVFDESELFSEEKFMEVKKLLDRFKSVDEVHKRWTEKVTDVRQWYTFGAQEINREDNSDREYYSDSSGKSGGQKEKLAYTILASAIVYQFGLSGNDSRSRSFRFVVIDEAFGRGSNESTRYGLKLFEKLNIQLLIVTPLQKINIIEDYVNAVHFVSNPGGNNSKVRNLTKTEYITEKDLHFNKVSAHD